MIGRRVGCDMDRSNGESSRQMETGDSTRRERGAQDHYNETIKKGSLKFETSDQNLHR